MTESLDSEAIAEVARDILAQVAPDELPLFTATSKAYFKNPERAVKQRSGDTVLGFGSGVDPTYLSPVVLPVVSLVMTFLLEELQRTSRHRQAGVTARAVRLLFKRFRSGASASPSEPGLTLEQLGRIRQVAYDRARQLRVPDDEAALLADAVVGSLAVA